MATKNPEKPTGSAWDIAKPSGSNYFDPKTTTHAPGIESVRSLLQRSRAYENDPVAYARFFALQAQMDQEELPELSVDQLRAEIERQTASLRPGTLEWARYQVALQRIYKNTDLRDLKNSRFELRGPNDSYEDIDRNALAMVYTGGEQPRLDPYLVAANPAALLELARPGSPMGVDPALFVAPAPTDLDTPPSPSPSGSGAPSAAGRAGAARRLANPPTAAVSHQTVREWQPSDSDYRIRHTDFGRWVVTNPYAQLDNQPVVYEFQVDTSKKNAFKDYYSYTITEIAPLVERNEKLFSSIDEPRVRSVRVQESPTNQGEREVHLHLGNASAPIRITIKSDYYETYYQKPKSAYRGVPSIEHRVQMIPILYYENQAYQNRYPDFDLQSGENLAANAAIGYNQVVESFLKGLSDEERKTVRLKFALYTVSMPITGNRTKDYMMLVPYLSAKKNGKEVRAPFTVNVKRVGDDQDVRSYLYAYSIPIDIGQQQLLSNLSTIGSLWGARNTPEARSGAWSKSAALETVRKWVDQFNQQRLADNKLPVFGYFRIQDNI